MLPNVDPNYIDFCYTFLYFVRYFVLKKYIFCYTFLKSIFFFIFCYTFLKSINIYIYFDEFDLNIYLLVNLY